MTDHTDNRIAAAIEALDRIGPAAIAAATPEQLERLTMECRCALTLMRLRADHEQTARDRQEVPS